MWQFLNKIEQRFLKQYTTIDLEDEIERIYSSYKLDTKVSSKSNVERFKGYVKKRYNILNDYGKFWAQKLLKRTKIQNNEIVEFLLYTIYNEKENELDEYENMTIKEIVQYTYETQIEAIRNDLPKEKRDKWKLPEPPLYLVYGLSLLSLPNANGYIWKEYKDAMTLFNSNEMYRHLVTNGNKNIKDILKKQKDRYLKIKKNPSKEDKYTGALEDELVYIVNQTKIKAYEDAGISKVRFIAVEDDRTTDICLGMNGQEFYINKMNVYDRYNFYDKKNVIYHTFGLKVGENLPPLHKNCRSTIAYIL